MDDVSRYDQGKVSVIIPACKSDKHLYLVFESLLCSGYQNYEIIIVCEGKERSLQRNLGIQRATGEYLLFLDSDQIITPGLLMECIELIKECDAIYIPEKIITPDWFGKFRNWERAFYNSTAVDCVKFIRNKDVPLYDETMSGPEDSDFDRRVKGKRLVSKNYLYHWDTCSVTSYLKKKAYYTKSMNLYKDKYPNDKLLDWKWRCIFCFIENKKWKRLILRPDFTICLFFLIFIRGIIYLYGTRSK